MAILYKTFNSARIVFFALLLAFSALAGAGIARADDPVYTVEDVTVDVTSDSAAKAREEAFAQAQQQAFGELAARMIDETARDAYATTDPAAISPMIQDFEVTQEKLSRVRYVGTYTFRFDPGSVKSYFSAKGASYSDARSAPTLVLPFLRAGNKTVLWDENNVWMQAWGRAGELKGRVPLMIPIGDVMDVSDFAGDDMDDYDPARLRAMTARYDASEAVFVMAVPDERLLATAPDATAQGLLNVQIFSAGSDSSQLAKTLTIAPDGGETASALYDRAVKQVRAALQGDWKSGETGETAGPATLGAQSARIEARVYFSGLSEWARAQREIAGTYGVRDFMVKSLSPTQALVELAYQGDLENLRLALAQNRMTLTPSAAGGHAYDLRLNAPAQLPGVPVSAAGAQIHDY